MAEEIILKRIDQLLTADIEDTSPIMFGIGTNIFKTTFASIKGAIQGDFITDLSYNLLDFQNELVTQGNENVYLNQKNVTINTGQLVFIRFKRILTSGNLSLDTYLIPLGEGVYNPLGASVSYNELILLQREETTVDQNEANTVTYTVTSLNQINTASPAFDFTDTDLVYFVDLDGDLYRFIGANGSYGDGQLQMTLNDLQLVAGAQEVTVDSVLNTVSNNPISNSATATEFKRTNFDSFELSSNLSSEQDFLDTNYRFLRKNINTTVNITLGSNVPNDYNCEGISQLDTIQVQALSGNTLIAPFGTTIGQGEYFRIRRVSSTVFSLEITKGFESGGVTSVNNQTGSVFLTADDIDETITRKYATGNELEPGDNISQLTNDEGYLTSVATANIDAEAVTNSKLSNMPEGTFKARITASGQPQDIPLIDAPINTATQNALDAINSSIGSIGSSTGGPESFVRTTTADDQTLNDGTFTILDYDTTTTNNDTANYSVSTDGRITVSNDGIYDISAGVVLRSGLITAAEVTGIGIFVNNQIVAFDSNSNILVADAQRAHTISTQINVNSGDIVDVRAFIQSAAGGTLDFLAVLLPVIFGNTATQVNNLSISKNSDGSVQSDFNETDNTSAAFIQNADVKQDKRTNTTVTKTNDTYTLQASDVDKRLFIPAPCTVIVPNGLAANLEFQGKQTGTGNVEFVAETGGTLNVNAAFQKFTEGNTAYWGIITLGNDEADLLGTLKLAE